MTVPITESLNSHFVKLNSGLGSHTSTKEYNSQSVIALHYCRSKVNF